MLIVLFSVSEVEDRTVQQQQSFIMLKIDGESFQSVTAGQCRGFMARVTSAAG